MEIKIYSENIALSDDLKALFEEKLAEIGKFSRIVKIDKIRVDIARDNHHRKGDVFKVEVNVDVFESVKVLRAVVAGPDIKSALDEVIKKIDRQARDVKEKKVDRRKKKTSGSV